MPATINTPPAEILVVEDERVIAADLTACLEDLGYHVVGAAASGEEALRQAERHHPDVVLMDIQLDGKMDGIAAADQLRRDWDIPVIFLTSHTDAGTIARARESQPYGYLTKPFADRELRAAIEMTIHRHKAESRLRKMERWTATTLHSIGDGVLATDTLCRVTFLNAAAERLTGWTHAEASGRNFDEVFHAADPDCQRRIFDLVREVILHGRVEHIVPGTRLVSRQHREFPVEDSIAPIRDDAGRITGAVVIFRDRSEMEHAEEEHRRMERKVQEGQKLESLGLLAGGIAHDFNNLLAGIGGNAALCRMKLPHSSPLHDYLHKIQTISHRAADLCKQMLAYAGKGKFQIAPIDLSAIVSDTTRLLHSSASRKAVIKLDLASTLPPVLADATQIQQILMNLVINASDAIGGCPGEIRLRTGTVWADDAIFAAAVQSPELPEGEYAFLEVEDTGCGMAPEIMARIFDPFFTTKFTGRGLGLAAVLGIVRGHHGALLVESAPGRGSRFRLLLPTVAAEIKPSSKTESAPVDHAPEWRGSGKVLVVDDEEDVRTVVAALLEEFGFEPVEAADGRAALTMCIAGGESFRMALMDLTMPTMDGRETQIEIHKLHPKLPVLFMSGYTEHEATVRFGENALSEFIQKPFLPSQLRHKIWSILQ